MGYGNRRDRAFKTILFMYTSTQRASLYKVLFIFMCQAMRYRTLRLAPAGPPGQSHPLRLHDDFIYHTEDAATLRVHMAHELITDALCAPPLPSLV